MPSQPQTSQPPFPKNSAAPSSRITAALSRGLCMVAKRLPCCVLQVRPAACGRSAQAYQKGDSVAHDFYISSLCLCQRWRLEGGVPVLFSCLITSLSMCVKRQFLCPWHSCIDLGKHLKPAEVCILALSLSYQPLYPYLVSLSIAPTSGSV